MPERSSKRPRDLNQLAASIVGNATDATPQAEPAEPDKPEKNPAAVALGKLGGKKGGPARAAKLSAEQRRDIARKAAGARWSKPVQ